MPTIRELEEKTANLWLSQGVITVECTGSENTYYVDSFGFEFYCKNYPQVAQLSLRLLAFKKRFEG